MLIIAVMEAYPALNESVPYSLNFLRIDSRFRRHIIKRIKQPPFQRVAKTEPRGVKLTSQPLKCRSLEWVKLYLFLLSRPSLHAEGQLYFSLWPLLIDLKASDSGNCKEETSKLVTASSIHAVPSFYLPTSSLDTFIQCGPPANKTLHHPLSSQNCSSSFSISSPLLTSFCVTYLLIFHFYLYLCLPVGHFPLTLTVRFFFNS